MSDESNCACDQPAHDEDPDGICQATAGCEFEGIDAHDGDDLCCACFEGDC